MFGSRKIKSFFLTHFQILLSSMFIPLRSNIKAVGVSAATGDGTERLFECFDEAAVEFQTDYLPELLK